MRTAQRLAPVVIGIAYIIFRFFYPPIHYDGDTLGLTVLMYIGLSLPLFLLLIGLALGWKWPLIGGIAGFVAFFNMLLYHSIFMIMRGNLPAAYLMSMPPLLVGILFLVNWQIERRSRKAPENTK